MKEKQKGVYLEDPRLFFFIKKFELAENSSDSIELSNEEAKELLGQLRFEDESREIFSEHGPIWD